MPYMELFFKELSWCRLFPKIRYLLKSFAVKKLESICTISESKIKGFSTLSMCGRSPETNAYELVTVIEKRSTIEKITALGIMSLYFPALL